jgi:hypothetical protein
MMKRKLVLLFLLEIILSYLYSPRIIYLVQRGTPVAIANFVIPEAHCNWSGIGGQVFNQDGLPVAGMVVQVKGSLEGQQILSYVITGSSLKLGPGGYEITLTDHLVSSQGTVYIQLFDLGGAPLSAQVPLTTYADCNQNLVIINLVQSHTDYDLFLPYIYK